MGFWRESENPPDFGTHRLHNLIPILILIVIDAVSFPYHFLFIPFVVQYVLL